MNTNLLVSAVLSVGFLLPAAASQVPGDEPLRIVAFGDSTTAPRGKLRVYSQILSEELAGAGSPVQIVNSGVGGNTTRNGLARFERDVVRHRPDVVIIQFGINDSAVDVWRVPPATESRIKLDEYANNLREMIRTLKDSGTHVILMTPNPLRWTTKLKDLYGKPPYDPTDQDGFNVTLQPYVNRVRQLAREECVKLIDVDRAFHEFGKRDGQTIDDLLLDGMHPNAAGHQLIAKMLTKELAEHVSNPSCR